MLVVGIGGGTITFAIYLQRMLFTQISKLDASSDPWLKSSGGDKFLRVQKEVVPYVEQHYHTDLFLA